MQNKINIINLVKVKVFSFQGHLCLNNMILKIIKTCLMWDQTIMLEMFH